MTCLLIGAALQTYGHVLAFITFNQRNITFFAPGLLTQSLILVPWMLCMLAALWVTMKAAQPWMGHFWNSIRYRTDPINDLPH